LISSNVDERDHAFILGSTNQKQKSLVSVMRAAEKQGLSGSALQEIEDKWTADSGLALYPDTIAKALKAQGSSEDKIKAFLAKVSGTAHASHDETSRIAMEEFGLKQLPYWNWDAPRTREGFYRYQGGTQCAINRAVEFAPYADLLWMETKSVRDLAGVFMHELSAHHSIQKPSIAHLRTSQGILLGCSCQATWSLALIQ
jgi:isocitrate lyase